MNKKLSVIIPTYNHLEDLLKPCIESLIEWTDLDDSIEIIVSANGCTDGTREYIEGLKHPSFKLIWNDEPLGFTKATNEGIKVATGEYVVLLNNDTEFLGFRGKNAWIDLLLEPFSDPTVGLTGPLKLLCPVTNKDFLVFFIVAIKREIIDKLGLLNEAFSPGGGEDTDYCIRAQNLGYKLVEVPMDDEANQQPLGHTVGKFPIFHKAEGTMHSDDVEWTKIASEDNWKDIFKRNTDKLKEMYNPDFNVLYIFPAYNEIEFIDDIIRWCRKNGLNIYVLDNYSTDGTWEYLNEKNVPCHRVDTDDTFDILKIQEKMTHVVKNLKPDWVIVGAGDMFIVHKENEKLYDFIKKIDSEGYTSLNVPVYTFHNTGEKLEHSYYKTFKYTGELGRRRLIFKYTDDFYFKADHVFMKEQNIKNTDEIIYLNYGQCRSIEFQDEKYFRRKRAWENGLDKEIGWHFQDGYDRRWLWKKEELNDIEKTPFSKFKDNIISLLSKKEDLVQIIIPTYKRYTSLEKTLKDVSKQTYSNIKVWVCSDGDDIKVEKIVNRFNSQNDIEFVYTSLKEKQGFHGAPARRYVMDIMDDEGFVCFVDDDNRIHKDFVEKLVNAFDDGIGITYCNIRINNEYVPREIVIPEKDEKNDFKEGRIDSLNFMIRVSLAKKHKDSWTNDYNHDFKFIKSISKETNSVFVSEILAYHTYDHRIENSVFVDETLKSYDYDNESGEFEGVYSEIILNDGYHVTDKEIRGKRVVDIGAHYGMFTALAITLGADKVVAVEPVPRSLEKLRETAKRYPRIKIIEKAIGKNDGDKVLILDDKHNSQETKDTDKGIEVNCITLKTILKEFPDDDDDLFLKMDCEGCEYNFIRHSDPEDIRRFSIIKAEFHEMDWIDGTMDSLRDYLINEVGFEIDHEAQVYFFRKDSNGKIVDQWELPARHYYFIRKDKKEMNINNVFKNDNIKRQDPETYSEVVEDNIYNLVKEEVQGVGVLDIGAYYGYFSMMALEMGAKKIISVEANPHSVDILKKNLDILERGDSVDVYNLAVTEPGLNSINVKNKGSSSFVTKDNGIEIEAIDLDQIVSKFESDLDLILKIDCEGYEYPILRGCDPDTLKRFRYIYGEFHDFKRIQDNSDSLLNYLFQLGFEPMVDLRGYVWDERGNVIETLPNRIIKLKNKYDSFFKVKHDMKEKKEELTLPNGWFSDDDIRVYRSLLKKIPDTSTFVEIGTYEGRSLCSVADIMKEKSLIAIAVDTFTGSSNIDPRLGLEETETERKFKNNLKRFGIKDRTIIYPSLSKDAKFKVNDDYVNLLFIDGDHSYDGVEQDILNWFDKVREGGYIMGHDWLWSDVRAAVENNLYDIHSDGNIWWMKKEGRAINLKPYVTAVISTRNRYFQTLPLAITAIALQTYRPKELIMYDDGKHLDLRKEDLYKNLFNLLAKKGIKWSMIFGEGIGQVVNHDRSINDAHGEWIWRIDDDNVPEHDVLEKLIGNVEDDVGAVAGLVLDPKGNVSPNEEASNRIEDIFKGLNIQWFPHGWKSEVDHLYSSFIYRRSAADHGYERRLSRVGFREETMFTYEMKRKGWRLIVDPSVTTWHAHYNTGGIRDNTTHDLWDHDEEIFKEKLKEWGVFTNHGKLIVLDNGLGDHIVFKKLLPKVLKKYGNVTIACCYEEVFEDFKDDVNLISIDMAKRITNIEKLNVYAWMVHENWKGNIEQAYEKMYEL